MAIVVMVICVSMTMSLIFAIASSAIGVSSEINAAVLITLILGGRIIHHRQRSLIQKLTCQCQLLRLPDQTLSWIGMPLARHGLVGSPMQTRHPVESPIHQSFTRFVLFWWGQHVARTRFVLVAATPNSSYQFAVSDVQNYSC
jgi:hypothetical protein